MANEEQVAVLEDETLKVCLADHGHGWQGGLTRQNEGQQKNLSGLHVGR